MTLDIRPFSAYLSTITKPLVIEPTEVIPLDGLIGSMIYVLVLAIGFAYIKLINFIEM
jgi:hypothetical protein